MGDPVELTERQRRARSIFQAALALPEIQRSTYVANVCRGELELRREVERMLELDRLRTGEVRRPVDPSAPPERVNNYDVVSKIGEGGMGAVFLCKHHFFDRNAALKVLHPHLCADETLVTRFLNEARAANAIRHVNIIEVIDAGLMADSGAPYLLMEHLQGENLAERLKRVGRFSITDALQVLGQTASALAAAHDQGIVHRDLKPENLFLVPRIDGGDQVKVLDFGIAKLRPEIGGKFVKTQPGAVVGTPAYMSPEQCLGNGEIDHRTDVYSLGVILFEMLSGRPPFEAEGMGGLLAAHILNEPPVLSSLLPDLPTYIELAVSKALAKKPHERFQTMRELRASLGELAVPRPLPQSAAQMAAQTLSGTPSSPPGFTPVPPSALKHPTPPLKGPNGSSHRETVMTAPMPVMDMSAADRSTLTSSATELGVQPPRPRRVLLWAGAVAVLALGAIAWVFGRTPAETAARPANHAVAGQVPAAPAVVAPPVPESAAPPEPVAAEAPGEKPHPAPAETADKAAEAPKPAAAVVAPKPRPKTTAPAQPGASKPGPRGPAAPKEFEPPLW